MSSTMYKSPRSRSSSRGCGRGGRGRGGGRGGARVGSNTAGGSGGDGDDNDEDQRKLEQDAAAAAAIIGAASIVAAAEKQRDVEATTSPPACEADTALVQNEDTKEGDDGSDDKAEEPMDTGVDAVDVAVTDVAAEGGGNVAADEAEKPDTTDELTASATAGETTTTPADEGIGVFGKDGEGASERGGSGGVGEGEGQGQGQGGANNDGGVTFAEDAGGDDDDADDDCPSDAVIAYIMKGDQWNNDPDYPYFQKSLEDIKTMWHNNRKLIPIY